ncbi:MAG: DUF2764 family protein [Candidatus Marinimicrobia bacterium]|jgi:hypothetical protein|nr:DUF2764 family protein [Candidatus Neomarinimicrobiota bacterium]
MDKYIYFAAEMPGLKWGSEQLISEENFLEEAEKWMTPADYASLSETFVNRYEAQNKSGLYNDFLLFENEVRTELAEYRRAAKEGYEYKFLHLPMQLIKDGNPLDIELKLMKYRWDWLEEREFGHYSDSDFFVLYYLKLQLLQRVASFKKELGEEAFEKLIKQNLENTDEASS